MSNETSQDNTGTERFQSNAYCHTPASMPTAPASAPGAFSRRTVLRGAGAVAGGLGLAAAGVGALGGLPGPFTAKTQQAGAAGGKALVIYDGEGQWGWIGAVHATLLTNLLGRFLPAGSATNTTVRKSTSAYAAGDIERYDATFYLGTVYDNPLPKAFKDDVMKTTKPVVWFKYNIHQLAWAAPDAFRTRFGMALYGNVSWPNYTSVMYKGKELLRNTIDPEVSWMDPVDPAKAQAVATLQDPSGTGPGKYPIPYITRSGNFWYVGDIPFSYISEEDRYLVIADVLFDAMGVNYTQTKRALVRIEDVDATADPADLRRVADLLSGQGVPFSVGVVPMYRDPLGKYNAGKSLSINLSAAKDVVSALKYMQSKGGELIMHGTTHQHGTDANPYNAVTGDDFEFFRVTENADHTLTYIGPISGDSSAWCQDLVNKGMSELQKAGLAVIGFEAPHYAASAADYKVFANKFKLTYHRALYFDSRPVKSTTATSGGTTTKVNTKSAPATTITAAAATPAPLNFGGQFFPYLVARDVYGQKILPENLGNIEPTRWPDPVLGPFPTRFPADIVRAAGRNLVVRDAWASFFFHPFLASGYLADCVSGIKGLGYQFVKASTVNV